MSRFVSVDVHVHTAASYDAEAPVDAVLAHAADAGLDAVAITDHDTMQGAREAMERAREYGIVVVPGVEVSTASGHLLALGVGTCPMPGQPLTETVIAVHEQDGAAVGDCDGIEVYNAMAMTGVQNRRARRFARLEEYPALGGSDAHTPAMVGLAVTHIELATDTEPLTAAAIVSAIRAGRTDYAGRRAPVRHYLKKHLHNARLRTAAGLASLASPIR